MDGVVLHSIDCFRMNLRLNRFYLDSKTICVDQDNSNSTWSGGNVNDLIVFCKARLYAIVV